MEPDPKNIEEEFRWAIKSIEQGAGFFNTSRNEGENAPKIIILLLRRPIDHLSTWEDLFLLRIVPECNQEQYNLGISSQPNDRFSRAVTKSNNMNRVLICSFSRLIQELDDGTRDRHFPRANETAR